MTTAGGREPAHLGFKASVLLSLDGYGSTSQEQWGRKDSQSSQGATGEVKEVSMLCLAGMGGRGKEGLGATPLHLLPVGLQLLAVQMLLLRC